MTNKEAIKHFNIVVGQLKYLDNLQYGEYTKDYIKTRSEKNTRRLKANRIAIDVLERYERSELVEVVPYTGENHLSEYVLVNGIAYSRERREPC